jgi:catechol 2,3-dioxygenase-like lactoylglutathione lyase family enzyme
MQSEVQGIFHPVVAVRNMNDALPFWRDALGLRVTFDEYHDPEAIASLFGYEKPVVHSVVVSCPDASEIELVEFEHPRGQPAITRHAGDIGLFSINLRVTGVEGIVERVLAGGYALTSDGVVNQVLPDGGVIKVAVVRGSDEVTVILVELPEGRGSLAG